MNIIGRNSSFEAELYPSLSEAMKKFNPNAAEKLIIQKIDNNFQQLENATNIPPLLNSEGKINWSRGYYFHKVSDYITNDIIISICNNGILPSERFGEYEGYKEMRFCVGVTQCNNFEEGLKLKNRNIYGSNGKRIGFDTKMSIISGVSLIIDPCIINNGAIDFFKYLHDGESNCPNYDQKILEFVKAMSPNAENIVTGMYRASYEEFNWHAIVGGIPVKYITGIFINTKDKNCKIETAIKFSNLLNCPIINENGEVVKFDPTSFKEQDIDEFSEKEIQ